MSGNIRQRWLSALIITGLSFPTSLVIAPNSWSQEKTNEIEQRQVKNSETQEHLDNIKNLSEEADAGQERSTSESVSEELSLYLQHPDLEVRRMAVDALTGIGIQDEKGVTVKSLIKILEEQNQPFDLRRNAIGAIQSINAGKAVDPLIKALDDPDPGVRSKAALALGSIEKKALDAVPKLISLVKNDNYEEVRGSAAEVLAKIDPTNEQVWSTLNEALDDSSWRVRRRAADALAVIGTIGALEAVPNLLTALENQNHTLRTSAATTLGLLGSEAKTAVPDLRKALQENDNHFAQAEAAAALGNIGADDPTTLEALIDALNDSDSIVREKAFKAFSEIADSMTNNLLEQPEIKPDELQQTIKYFEAALEQMELPNSDFSEKQRKMLEHDLHRLQREQSKEAFINIILKNPWLWGIIIYLALHLGLFWLRPLWLLKIDQVLKPLSFKVPILGTEISPRFLVFLKFHDRVLDAWVAAHIQSVQEEFQKIIENIEKKKNVEPPQVYIPIPATLDHSAKPQIITNQDLRAKFNRHLLIWGEGGVGKTSLSYQIAQWAMADKEHERLFQHRMIPILIEKDLKQPLLKDILRKLENLTKAKEQISEELLERLLRRQRVLVIVDHLSEMSKQTQETIDPGNSDFPINALIVTSRQEDTLDGVNKTTIKPLRIGGKDLSDFLQEYLKKKDPQTLFNRSEFFHACGHLSQMVGEQDVTAMLATLFADQLIYGKVKAAKDTPVTVSNNIPDLMLECLNRLNRDLTNSKSDEDRYENAIVRQDAKVVAWACVQEKYYPLKITREKAIEALEAVRGERAEDHLQYLEERLHLIQTIGVNEDQIRFSDELLAEYLAALHLIDCYKGDEKKWLAFLERAKAQPNSPTAISGFLEAVHNCLDAISKEANLSSQIFTKLAQIQNKAVIPQKVLVEVS